MTDEQRVRERRSSDRIPLEGSASVRILESEVIGPSRNISQEGIYFIAEAEMPVEVTLPSKDVLKGKIVRIGAVREGELGIAVRFDERLSPDQLPELTD